MAVCSQCGSQVAEGTKFCPACGAATGSGTAPPAGPAERPPTPATPPAAGQGGMAPNVAAMLTYLPVCFIGLVCAILFGFALAPYNQNRYIRFHAWQSLALHGALLVLSIGWMIFGFILTAIAKMFVVITAPVFMLIGLGGLVLMVVLMIKAYGNQTFKVPVLGDWAEKQANG